MFLAAIWSSLCLSYSMCRFIPPVVVLAPHDCFRSDKSVDCFAPICRLSSGKYFFRRSFWEAKETTWKESPPLRQRQADILRSRCLLSDYSQVILRSIPLNTLLLSDLAQCFLTGTQRSQLRFYTSEFPSHDTRNWNIRLFPKPVGSTASRSPRDTSVRIALVCSVRNLRDIPKWDKPALTSKNKHINLQFIGRHQSINLRPHQSQTPFVGERRFSKKQWLPADVFFLPLPLPLYFSFHSNSHSLGRIFVSPQASSEFESKMALDWSRCARSPKYACIAG